MNGSIKERIIKSGKNKKGKIIKNLKVYDCYYRYPCPHTGKSKQTSRKGFRKKGDAEAFLLELNSQIAGNNFIPPKKLTVREYLLGWLETYVEPNLRKSTIAGYKINIEKHIIPRIGNIELKDLTSSHLDSFYALKQKEGRLDGKGGLAPKTVLYLHRVLSEALEHAIRKGLLTRNVAKYVTNLPRLKKFQSTVLETEEIRTLLNLVKDTDMEAPIALAAICGLRRGEILGLKESEISWEKHLIRICRQLIATNNGRA